MQSFKFFARFVTHPRGVGALCPSSSRLASAMMRDFELREGDTVVEYGVGTGAFTRLIHERQRAVGGGEYLGIEREESFHTILTQRMPKSRFVLGSVEDVRHHLEVAGLEAPRLIVSGLPLILMSDRVMEQIVRTAGEVLRPGGSFRTFSYLHSWPWKSTRRLRALMREHFDDFGMRGPTWWNCPPAFVLRGDKSA